MIINNKNLTEYNANLLDRQISPSNRDIFSFWTGKNIDPFLGDVEYGFKPLLLQFEFKGTADEIQLNKNKLLSEIEKSTIKFSDIDRFYTGYVVANDTEKVVRGFEVVSVAMNVIEHDEEVVINTDMAQELKIDLNSNFITPVILEVKPTINLVDVTITGFGEPITLKNLTGYKTIIVDGEKGYVTEQGKNKYNDYDSWGFPYLSPGANTITVNKKTVDLKIKFKPRWI